MNYSKFKHSIYKEFALSPVVELNYQKYQEDTTVISLLEIRALFLYYNVLYIKFVCIR